MEATPMSDGESVGDTHRLYRELDYRKKEWVEVEDGELEWTREDQILAVEAMKTIHCECGESYRTEENAIDHIRSVNTDAEGSDR